jgi:hypothetical protein
MKYFVRPPQPGILVKFEQSQQFFVRNGVGATELILGRNDERRWQGPTALHEMALLNSQGTGRKMF